MTSQPGWQTIAIDILPKISQSNGYHTTEFGHLIEFNKRNIFFQKLCKKWSVETSYRRLFIFLKSLIWSSGPNMDPWGTPATISDNEL